MSSDCVTHQACWCCPSKANVHTSLSRMRQWRGRYARLGCTSVCSSISYPPSLCSLPPLFVVQHPLAVTCAQYTRTSECGGVTELAISKAIVGLAKLGHRGPERKKVYVYSPCRVKEKMLQYKHFHNCTAMKNSQI